MNQPISIRTASSFYGVPLDRGGELINEKPSTQFLPPSTEGGNIDLFIFLNSHPGIMFIFTAAMIVHV